MLLGFRQAAGKARVSVRTLHNWREEGMRVQVEGRRVFVDLEVVLAWKRWKSLQNPAAGHRRARAAAAGYADAVVSSEQIGRAHRDWVLAGGGRR